MRFLATFKALNERVASLFMSPSGMPKISMVHSFFDGCPLFLIFTVMRSPLINLMLFLPSNVPLPSVMLAVRIFEENESGDDIDYLV